MIIANQFTLNVHVDTAWALLSDMEQVVPLMPGAALLGREGDEFLAKVKVKVGPVTSEFSGKAHFLEKDDANHRALIDGRARDSKGGGNASAVITLQAKEDGDRTSVTVDTDLKIVGKLAQFGSGMLQQVSEKLLDQFVAQLEARLSGGAAAAAPAAEASPVSSGAVSSAVSSAAAGSVTAGGVATVQAPAPAAAAPRVAPPAKEPEALDLLELAGGTAVTKYAAGGVIVVLLVVIAYLLGRLARE
jgi:carbon monoxide dehydrogenase subunit G